MYLFYIISFPITNDSFSGTAITKYFEFLENICKYKLPNWFDVDNNNGQYFNWNPFKKMWRREIFEDTLHKRTVLTDMLSNHAKSYNQNKL